MSDRISISESAGRNGQTRYQGRILPDVADISYGRTVLPVPQPRIALVGVGGAGTNALHHIGHVHGDAVRLIALNTDTQTLQRIHADDHFCLGESITQGSGAGGMPEVGNRAAEASHHHIATLLRGYDLVFVMAGMGGGTGTGAAPVVARIAREQGALTIGMVTIPFAFEGQRRRRIADIGQDQMHEAVDALITLPNDRLLQVTTPNQTLNAAFAQADEALRRGISGIVEIVTITGLINVDFADVRTILREAGTCVMALGEASGNDRAREAVEDAMTCGWLHTDIRGAQRVLVNITGSPDLTLHEVTEVSNRIAAQIDPQAQVMFGAVIHPDLADTLRVTLVAAGLPKESVYR